MSLDNKQLQYSLRELAALLNGEVIGDPDLMITGVAPIQQAKIGQLSFLDNKLYRKYLATTQASVVILSPQYAKLCPVSCIVLSNPHAAYAKAAQMFVNRLVLSPGIHPSAVIGQGCTIDPTVYIGPNCVLEDNVAVGKNSTVGPGCVLGHGVVIGDDCTLWANVTIYHDVEICNRVTIHSGTVIGSDGFGYAHEHGRWIKVPQLGSVVIHDDVEIGSCTSIDRGTIDNTVIEQGVKLDNQIQVGHNVVIGEHTAIAACTGISGSVKIGKHCRISGMVGFTGHFTVADNVAITGMTKVSKSIISPGVYSSGTGIEPHQKWRKNAVRFRELDQLARKLKKIEVEIQELKGNE